MRELVFDLPHRELTGLTAGVEARVLAWLAARTPAWVGPDHLTTLGLLGSLLAGFGYALSARDLQWLHAVNLALALNWLGDSLDGTLARFRRCERPHYGFYLDHMTDAFGVVFLLGGLALSGHVAAPLALAVLLAYLLLSIHIALAACSLGRFRISWGPVGGTELRLLLVGANLALLRWPVAPVLGRPYRLFDVLGVLGLLGILAALLAGVGRSTLELWRRERVDYPVAPAGSRMAWPRSRPSSSRLRHSPPP